MPPRPGVVVFDVNETLSDMAPLGRRFAELGVPETLAGTWFAALLRDGFALTAAGGTAPFARLAAGALRTVLAGAGLDRPVDEAARHVLDGFAELTVHPDVPAAVRLLRGRGLRLVTLSNGSAAVAGRLLSRAGLGGEFERLLSVEQAGTWKPAPASYAYAARECGAAPGDMVLVAVHPWDIHGAHQAGLATGWVSRRQEPYPDYFAPPDLAAGDLLGLAQRIADWPV